MSIVQYLIIDEYGAYLGKHSERLMVTKNSKKFQSIDPMSGY